MATIKKAGKALQGFTRTLLAGFTIKSACRDGSHAGIYFSFNGGRRNDGAKFRLDYDETGMTDEQSISMTQALIGAYRYPDDVPAVFGLTFKGLATDGKFREAFITNNGAQYGARFQMPTTKLGVIPRSVWEAVAREILATCVSPFSRDDENDNKASK